jgi:hypothetical protein
LGRVPLLRVEQRKMLKQGWEDPRSFDERRLFPFSLADVAGKFVVDGSRAVELLLRE